ncbi:MAG: transposase [Muribaculaceae bacterium]|nr:transposase [Muribaculaceae bacterium]MDE6428159.1 transposase [Muribaculaceae bacterium]
MANTYTKIYLHVVFAVKNREALIPAIYLPELHAYIGGIIKKMGHTPMCIGGTENHIHCLIQYNLNQSIPDMVRDLKCSSSAHINRQNIIPFRFEWQRGYACFSISHSHIDSVTDYIRHQFEHHNNVTLEDEIIKIMKKYDIDYDPQYIIRAPDQ